MKFSRVCKFLLGYPNFSFAGQAQQLSSAHKVTKLSVGMPFFAMPTLVRMTADCILLVMAFSLAKVVSFLSAEPAPGDATALLSSKFWFGDSVSVLSATAVAIGVFLVGDLYKPTRRDRTHHKILLVVAEIAVAYLLIAALSSVSPLINFPLETLFWAWLFSSGIMLSSRVWSLVWRRVLAVEKGSEKAEKQSEKARVETLPERSGECRVLLIGGAGYIGSALLPKLLDEGWHVRLMDLFLYGKEPIQQWLEHPNLEVVKADFRQVDSLVKAMSGMSEVIHLGGIVGDPACSVDEELTIDINLAATRAIAEVAKGMGVRRLIFASSCSVYGASNELLDEQSSLNPVSLYARTKIASEKVLLSMRDENFEPILLRFATVYGLSGRTRFDLVVNLLSAKAVIDGKITIINGEQWRPFVHVDDVARAIIAVLRATTPLPVDTPIFNVGSNKENYLIRQVGELVKTVVPEAALIHSDTDEDRRNYRVSFDKIANVVGFQAQWTVEEGIKQIIDNIKACGIQDYSDPRFSNVKALIEMANKSLSKPQPHWARELVTSMAAAQ